MRVRPASVVPFAVALAGTMLLVNVAIAQTNAVDAAQSSETPPSRGKAAKAKHPGRRIGWRVSPALGVDAEYDDNVFLLAANRKGNVAAPSGAEITSGRYADMKRAHDLLTTLSAGLSLSGPGLLGKSFLIVPEVSYEFYAQNTARSNVSLGLSLQQKTWADGRMRLQGRLTPSYFARNYMTDAVDLDASGSIADDERVYARGEYREGEVGADYRLPLQKSTKKHPFGAALQMGGGYYGRSYDAALTARNLGGPTASAKLLLDLSRRVEFDLGYEYASLAATPSNQLLLLDEPDFGQDFNGNGTASDLDARVLTMVDRSRKEQSLGATLGFQTSKQAGVTLGYEYRWRRYTSDESLDVVNRGRRDARHQISADVRFRLARDLRLRLAGIHSIQNLNRSGDPGSAGEIDDYTRSQGRLGLSYEL